MDKITMISAANLSLKIGEREILRDISVGLQAGETVGLIGPNGSGKTSLMRAIMRFNPEAKGECNLWSLKPKIRARNVAWLAQLRHVAWGLQVEEVIALGRTAWRDWHHKSQNDQSHVDDAIARLGLESYRHRKFHNLSGGEQARVLLARVIAQDTKFILADEPIDALDPAQQMLVMELFRSFADAGKGVLLAIHDLNLAARYCTRLILLDNGEIIASGAPDSVLSDANLEAVFGVRVFRAEAQGPIIQPIQIVEADHE